MKTVQNTLALTAREWEILQYRLIQDFDDIDDAINGGKPEREQYHPFDVGYCLEALRRNDIQEAENHCEGLTEELLADAIENNGWLKDFDAIEGADWQACDSLARKVGSYISRKLQFRSLLG